MSDVSSSDSRLSNGRFDEQRRHPQDAQDTACVCEALQEQIRRADGQRRAVALYGRDA